MGLNSKLKVHWLQSRSRLSGHSPHTPRVTVDHNSKLTVYRSRSRSRPSGMANILRESLWIKTQSSQFSGQSHSHGSPATAHTLRESLWAITPSLQFTGHGHGHGPLVTDNILRESLLVKNFKLTVLWSQSRSRLSGHGLHTPRVTVGLNSKLIVHWAQSRSRPSGHGPHTPQVTVNHNSKLKVLWSKSRSWLSGHGPHTPRVTVGHHSKLTVHRSRSRVTTLRSRPTHSASHCGQTHKVILSACYLSTLLKSVSSYHQRSKHRGHSTPVTVFRSWCSGHGTAVMYLRSYRSSHSSSQQFPGVTNQILAKCYPVQGSQAHKVNHSVGKSVCHDNLSILSSLQYVSLSLDQ